MSEECNHDCNGCGSAGSCSQNTASLQTPLHPLSRVNKVIAVVSGKGGVGKSLVTGLLATSFQRKGYTTAILDADITGPSIPKMFGVGRPVSSIGKNLFPAFSRKGIQMVSLNLLIENPEDPVIWRSPVISGAVKQFWQEFVWEEVDCMFVDMPPGTGDVPLTVFQSLPVAGIVVVTSPQELVSMIVGKAVKMAEIMKVPVLGIVENMSYFMCPNCNTKHKIYGESHVEEIAKMYSIDVLAKIPIEPQLAALCDAGKIEDFQGDWLDEAVEKLR